MYERRDNPSNLTFLCLSPNHVVKEFEVESLPLIPSDKPIVVSIVLKQELLD